MKIKISKLINAKSKYDSELGEVERQLSKYIDFDFSVFYQPSDGFVLLAVESCQNAPLSVCIGIINEKGKLTYSDYSSVTI